MEIKERKMTDLKESFKLFVMVPSAGKLSKLAQKYKEWDSGFQDP